MKTNILYSKKASSMAKVGMDVGMAAIFIIAIGLAVAQAVITNLTTGGVNASLQGVSATVANYAPLIIVAGFIFFVSRIFGII